MGCSIYAVRESDIEDIVEEELSNDIPTPTDDLAEKGMMSVTTEPLQPNSTQPTRKANQHVSDTGYGDELD